MTATRKFPLEMVHDGIKGTATAHSESSYKVLHKNGWRPKFAEPDDAAPTEPAAAAPAGSSKGKGKRKPDA